jgi:hypothetical protein
MLLALAYGAFVTGRVSMATDKESTKVQIRQVACGAIVRDNFNSGAIDSSVWHTMSLDPGIEVGIENGELVIRGTSARIADDVLRKNPAALCRYAGLYSRSFPQVDACLAVRVKMPSGISPEQGTHVVCVHLCGVQPDCSSEVVFGRMDEKVIADTIREYIKGHPERYQRQCAFSKLRRKLPGQWLRPTT